jgi:hypothetical protein
MYIHTDLYIYIYIYIYILTYIFIFVLIQPNHCHHLFLFTHLCIIPILFVPSDLPTYLFVYIDKARDEADHEWMVGLRTQNQLHGWVSEWEGYLFCVSVSILIDWLIDELIHSFIHWLTDWRSHWLM